MCQFKDGCHFLSSKECSNEAHMSQHIYEYVGSCIQEVGPEHIVQIVTDNATNNMGAAKFKKVLDQAKQVTIFIYAHHKTLAMMRKFTNKRDIIRLGVTKFASVYLTLQKQLRHMFSSNEWEECKFSYTVKGGSSHTLVTGSTFWAGVTLCLKVFSPLVKVLL
uniref:DUF659 domain-containing protein n=1 Tax=Lactuca sativa TaxID=4236 RepID=A0A9R1XCR8_LACSA|nr:hypothetical protein LSAT_V11C500272870 [Lactuca sativa]